MSKRILSLVLALVMVLGTFGTVFAADTTQTTNERVNKLIELELVKGYEDGTYGLDKAITRAEVATMVVRALDLEAVANASMGFTSAFSDMNSSDVVWSRGYVTVAAAEGVVKGYEDGTFGPRRDITYAEVATMLVRVLGGLTEDEEKLATGMNWSAIYLARATQLGIFEDVAVTDYTAVAVREKIFEMVYNALLATDLLIANTVEGIVVENYRTENVAKDDIVVHVMENQIEQSGGKYDLNDEFKVTIDKELKAKGLDVETLLGKVVRVAFDKDDKVIDVKVNDNYQYLQGEIESIGSKDIKMDGKFYTVEKRESISNLDERLFQVYLNNEDVYFDDLTSLDNDKKVVLEAEYAKLTVRNGKVLFVDAFMFEDIAPVAKDIDAKDLVAFYDDARDGEVRTVEVDEDAYVINFEDGEVNLGDYKEISANDVIHWFTDYRKVTTVFVRAEEDNKVEGTYKEATAAKAREAASIKILVDKTEYPAVLNDNHRDPVYSTVKSALEFQQLTDDYAVELSPFEDEEVVVLLDMFGNVQLVGSETVDGRFYAIISNILNNEFKLLRSDNENEYYVTTLRGTEFEIEEWNKTKEAHKNEFEIGNLVRATSKEDLLTNVTLPMTSDEKLVTNMTNDVIDFGGGDFYYISKNAPLFIVVDGEAPKATTVASFLKDYVVKNADGTFISGNAKAYVVENENLADVIVITDFESKVVEKSFVAKVVDVTFTGGRYWVRLQQSDGTIARHLYGKVAPEVKKGDIVTAKVLDNEAQDISSLTPIILEGAFEVINKGRDAQRGENFVILEDATGKVANRETLWISRNADIFGSYTAGSLVMIKEGTYDRITVLNVVPSTTKLGYFSEAPDDEEVTELVTYIVDATYDSATFNRVKVTDSDEEVSYLALADFETFKSGDVEVPEASMLAWINAQTTGTYVIDVEGTELSVRSAAPAAVEVASIDTTTDYDVSVAYDTDEADVIAELATETTITDNFGAEFTVALDWTIASYDGTTAETYTATGQIAELPELVGYATGEDATNYQVTSTVTVEAESSAKAITATTVGVLYAGDIVNVPAETKVADLKAGLTVSDFATVEILDGTGGTAVTDQATTDVTATMVIEVTAQDGTTAEYTIAME